MNLRGAALLVALALLAPSVAASHSSDTIPATQGDAPIDDALAWLDDNGDDENEITAQGCYVANASLGCDNHWTKWIATAAAHAGADPTSWPSQDGAIGDWVLDHADDLRDRKLRQCQDDENKTQADCSDDRVFSLAKSILAIAGTGTDPRNVPLPDGGERDVVADLLEEHRDGEFGKQRLANDDVWALIGLNAAGYDGPEVDDAIDRVEQAQGLDGGVAYATGESPSVDLTGSAVMALEPHGREDFVDSARSYLADQQTTSGENRACWPVSSSPAFPTNPNAESTSRAVLAITAMGEDPTDWAVDGQTPIECLRSFQSDSGGFRHADGARVDVMPTHQALTALTWRPYGTVDAPVEPLEATDEATVDEEHTVAVPDTQLRIDDAAVDEHTFTPNETGQRVFHGFSLDPVRPATVTVHVTEEGETSGGSDGSSSTDQNGGGSGGTDADENAPSARLTVPAQAERNVSFSVHVNGTPDGAPITAFRVDAPGIERTDWQPAGTFDVRLDALGETTVQAWARDADGHVSEPAEASVELVDASPRIELDGPVQVNRTEPATFVANASDPDGPAPSIQWTSGEGSASGAQATFAFDEPGPDTVQATATDRTGQATNASLTVHAVNRAPGNLTVAPRMLDANATTVVTANATDPDGDAVSITWTPTDGRSSTGHQLHVEAGAPGTRTVLVNASDGYGGWARALVEFTVREAPEPEDEPGEVDNVTTSTATRAPTTKTAPVEQARVELPDTVRATENRSRLLHGTAHSPSGVVNVAVALGGELPVRGTSNFTALVPALPSGTYEVSARAADAAGWGPWTSTQLVVEEKLEPASTNASASPAERSTPGPGALLVPALAALALARRPKT